MELRVPPALRLAVDRSTEAPLLASVGSGPRAACHRADDMFVAAELTARTV